MPNQQERSQEGPSILSFNVAQRLAQAESSAKEMGFEVRKIALGDQAPGWCRVGGQKILFLDITSSTSEQLAQLDEIVASYCNHRGGETDGRLVA